MFPLTLISMVYLFHIFQLVEGFTLSFFPCKLSIFERWNDTFQIAWTTLILKRLFLSPNKQGRGRKHTNTTSQRVPLRETTLNVTTSQPWDLYILGLMRGPGLDCLKRTDATHDLSQKAKKLCLQFGLQSSSLHSLFNTKVTNQITSSQNPC